MPAPSLGRAQNGAVYILLNQIELWHFAQSWLYCPVVTEGSCVKGTCAALAVVGAENNIFSQSFFLLIPWGLKLDTTKGCGDEEYLWGSPSVDWREH